MAWQTTMRRVFAFMIGSAEESSAEGEGAQAQPIRGEMVLGAQEPPLTQEDWYWGRNTAGTEEDFFWRRLSDNWYMKDVQPKFIWSCTTSATRRITRTRWRTRLSRRRRTLRWGAA